jgi:hypothetical protein
MINENNILVYSSLVFVSNFITARFKKQHFYSTWFYLLTITSLLYHGFFNGSLIMNLIDKVPIAGIITTGFCNFITKLNDCAFIYQFVISLLVISSFLSVIYFYCYGFYNNKYCYDSDKFIANKYHALLHVISSLGHHAIIFM